MDNAEFYTKYAEFVPRDNLSREQYEQHCTRASIPCHDDAKIRSMSYGLHYGDFTPPSYTVEYAIEMGLALHRILTLEAEDKATRATRPKPQPDYPEGRKLDCGCIVNWKREVMHASMGTSCQNCYDRMSD